LHFAPSLQTFTDHQLSAIWTSGTFTLTFLRTEMQGLTGRTSVLTVYWRETLCAEPFYIFALTNMSFSDFPFL